MSVGGAETGGAETGGGHAGGVAGPGLLRRIDRRVVMPWVGTACRVLLAAVWIVAGVSKFTDLPASVRAVQAYRILPFGAEPVGAALPMVEVTVGVLLMVGLGTRVCAVLSTGLLVAFSVGIASAWIRGLSIDCGCFGDGGDLAPGESPRYGGELLRDAVLLAAALLLILRPRTRLALETRLDREHEETST